MVLLMILSLAFSRSVEYMPLFFFFFFFLNCRGGRSKCIMDFLFKFKDLKKNGDQKNKKKKKATKLFFDALFIYFFHIYIKLYYYFSRRHHSFGQILFPSVLSTDDLCCTGHCCAMLRPLTQPGQGQILCTVLS